MEDKELANVLSSEELDNNAKAEAIQKIIGSKYVPATIVTNERKIHKEKLDNQQKAYSSLQTDFDTFKQSKMTEDEKKQAEIIKQKEGYDEALRKVSRYSAISVFAGAGLKEEDYSDFLEDIVGLDEEKTKNIAQKICGTITKQKTAKEEEMKNAIINGTQPPPAGNNNNSISKTEVERYQALLQEAQKNNNMLDMVYYERLISEANNKK